MYNVQFKTRLIKLWELAETRHEAQRNLTKEFPGIEVNRKLMMDTVKKLRRKGFDLKDIPPDRTRIDYVGLGMWFDELKKEIKTTKHMSWEEQDRHMQKKGLL